MATYKWPKTYLKCYCSFFLTMKNINVHLDCISRCNVPHSRSQLEISLDVGHSRWDPKAASTMGGGGTFPPVPLYSSPTKAHRFSCPSTLLCSVPCPFGASHIKNSLSDSNKLKNIKIREQPQFKKNEKRRREKYSQVGREIKKKRLYLPLDSYVPCMTCSFINVWSDWECLCLPFLVSWFPRMV